MWIITEHLLLFSVMGLAMLSSMFFSLSEAAFFSLAAPHRKIMLQGTRLQRMAAQLAEQSEKILPVILFWNLLTNLLIFSLSTILSMSLQNEGRSTEAGLCAVGVLLAVILFCEMLPKDFGVLFPRFFTVLFALPLSIAIKIVKPILPFLNGVNILLRRLLFPRFQPEPFLQVSDLERLVKLSRKDATLLRSEQRVLQSIVHLSEVTAEELMRPRKMLHLYNPPVTLEYLDAHPPEGDYVFITEPNTDEIASAVSLEKFTGSIAPEGVSWDAGSSPVAYVPWSMTLAGVLETLQKQERDVAAILNEYGETIGVISIQDITYFIFALAPSRTRLLLNRSPIRQVEPGRWVVSGITNLRRLKKFFKLESLPPCDALTVAGILQEELERMPKTGDVCLWGPFLMTVLESSPEDGLKVEIQLTKEAGS